VAVVSIRPDSIGSDEAGKLNRGEYPDIPRKSTPATPPSILASPRATAHHPSQRALHRPIIHSHPPLTSCLPSVTPPTMLRPATLRSIASTSRQPLRSLSSTAPALFAQPSDAETPAAGKAPQMKEFKIYRWVSRGGAHCQAIADHDCSSRPPLYISPLDDWSPSVPSQLIFLNPLWTRRTRTRRPRSPSCRRTRSTCRNADR
jgi:hypothetical protein